MDSLRAVSPAPLFNLSPAASGVRYQVRCRALNVKRIQKLGGDFFRRSPGRNTFKSGGRKSASIDDTASSANARRKDA